uniref:Zn(2)-C6 fungal-type domain-containing protein n=1 Tax=Lotharella oceanica TaxID=641309 RepID=A0A7S2U108_9EUKA
MDVFSGNQLSFTKPPLLGGFDADVDDWGSLLSNGAATMGEQTMVGEEMSRKESVSSFPWYGHGSELEPFQTSSKPLFSNREKNKIRKLDELFYKPLQLSSKSIFPQVKKTDSLSIFGPEALSPVHVSGSDSYRPPVKSSLVPSQWGGMKFSRQGSDLETDLLRKSLRLSSKSDSVKSEPEESQLSILPSVTPSSLVKRKRAAAACLDEAESEEAYDDYEPKFKKRRFFAAACVSCKASKIRCGTQRPCHQCQRRGHPCVEQPSKRASFDHPDPAYAMAGAIVSEEKEFFFGSEKKFLDLLVGRDNEDDDDVPRNTGKKPFKRLADRHSRYKGKACYRDPLCVRPFKHSGHCKRATK